MDKPKRLFCTVCMRYRKPENFSFIDPTHLDKGDMGYMIKGKWYYPRGSGVCKDCYPAWKKEQDIL